MKRHMKIKYKTRVCKLGVLRKKYEQMQQIQTKDVYIQGLLDEMKMRIEALEYILG